MLGTTMFSWGVMRNNRNGTVVSLNSHSHIYLFIYKKEISKLQHYLFYMFMGYSNETKPSFAILSSPMLQYGFSGEAAVRSTSAC